MAFVMVNGVKMAFETYGNMDNPPLVLLHGGAAGYCGMEMFQFCDLIHKFARKFYVYAYDRRGNGRTGFTESFTFEDHANDVGAFLDALCLDKAAVLGISGGSYVLGRAAALRPEKFSHVILVVPNHHAEGGTPANAALIRRGIDPSKISMNEMANALDEMNWAPTTPAEFKAAFYKDNTERVSKFHFDPQLTNAGYAEMANWDNREGLKTLEMPVLVVSGKYDGINPPEIGREIANLVKNGTFLEFEKSGHSLHCEQGDDLVAAVEKFVLG